jgi:hypothetical protein
MELILPAGSFIICQIVTLALVRWLALRNASALKVALIGGIGNAIGILAFGLTSLLLGKGPFEARVFPIALAAVAILASLLFIVGYVIARGVYDAYVKRQEEEEMMDDAAEENVDE